ncbi:MAG TPA: right-handed parallel beta-helix repeat-containing protein [Acidimicrobiales bacterium]|nr:right-handed parallel beta-helix repeat-containing protein [Acidimicrobiales bacterium]
MSLTGFGAAVAVNGRRNTIGQPRSGNQLDGNEVGADVLGSRNVVAGNRIGGQVFRTESAFASGTGVVVGGRANRVEDNVMVGGAGAGVRLVGGTDNEVVGNFIGLERDGTAAANQGPGLAADLGASGDEARANTIAHNVGAGVQMGPLVPAPLELTRNSIFANGGVGIDLSGVPTSCDEGLPPAPKLNQVDSVAGTASGAACPGSRVEVFGAAPDPSGAGEGKNFLAAATAGPDGGFSVSGLTLRGEEALTATATRTGATSAFAPNFGVPDIFVPGPVSGLQAAQRDSSTVELSWGAAADDAGTTRPAQRYQVRQSTSPVDTAGFDADGVGRLCEGDCFTGTLGAAGDPVRFTVTDLVPGVRYHWAVRAIDSAGLVGPVATVSLGLDDLAPASVSDLTARPVSGSEIELVFSAPGANGNGPPAVREYLIRQSSSPIDTSTSFEDAKALCGDICRFAPGRVGERLTLSVTRLRPNTTYHYAVVAVDDSGLRSPLSNPASATTLDSLACPAIGAPGAGEIAYPGGYSLVGLPDGTRLPADSPLYGWFDLGDGGSYSVQEPTEPVIAGRGYWAWFACPRLITPGAGATTTLQFPLSDYHASMVGNPSATDETPVTGHDFAARWDPSLNGGVGGYLVSGYRQPESLAPGAGAWVFSYRDTTIQLGP